MGQVSSFIPAIAGLIAFCMVSKMFTGNDPLDAIPSVGFSGPLSYYYNAFKFTLNGTAIIKEGYDKYKGGIFKVATLERWRVVVSGHKMIEDLQTAPDDELSFLAAAFDMIHTRWTLGLSVRDNPYHIPLIGSQLIRNLNTLFPEIHDEVVTAWEDALPFKGDEWIKVPALNMSHQIVTRASNRLFVGLPLCRDPDYIALNIGFTIDIMKTIGILILTPSFLRFVVGRLLTSVPASLERGVRHLKPIIEERQRLIDEYGKDYPEKPNDFLAWLMDIAEGEERDPGELTRRILAVNFTAIHTSSMAFTHALYYLAAMPQYLEPLREEVETVVQKQGWTKLALSNMRKVDSFFKESLRMNGIGSLVMTRKVLKDFTFSNGIRLPAGTFVSAAALATHYEEEFYQNPDVFDGFRFATMRDAEGEGVKHQLVSTNLDYLAFSHGKHACPGRFFAAHELKLMFAHLVVSYDVKLEDEGVRPANFWFGESLLPNPKAHVLFRKRQT